VPVAESTTTTRPTVTTSTTRVTTTTTRRSRQIRIATDHVAEFKGTSQVTGDELAKLGGDTLQRLVDGVAAYLAAHPADYPGYAGIEKIRWAQRDG